MAMFVIHTFNQ